MEAFREASWAWKRELKVADVSSLRPEVADSEASIATKESIREGAADAKLR